MTTAFRPRENNFLGPVIKRSYNIGFGALACFVNDYGNWLEVAEIELFLFTTFSILLVYQLWCIETACKDVIDMNLEITGLQY